LQLAVADKDDPFHRAEDARAALTVAIFLLGKVSQTRDRWGEIKDPLTLC
jgi:hypothetical protein